jgi:hypothetical protein
VPSKEHRELLAPEASSAASSGGARGPVSGGYPGTSVGGSGGGSAAGTGGRPLGGSGGSIGSSGGRASFPDASVAKDAAVPLDVPVTCLVTFAVTTVTMNGRYAPHNSGAIWVETASGAFVKTLEYWGYSFGLRSTYAVPWLESSKGNLVDAVTAATRTTHGPLNATWNCKDTAEHLVPRGKYRACVTVAEDNRLPYADAGAPQPVLCVPFTAGEGPFDLSPPDAPPFLDLHVSVR